MITAKTSTQNISAWASCLYKCRIIHERLTPRHHKFSYGMFMLYLDLDELVALDAACKIFSVDSPNVFSFYQSDHLKDCPGPPNLLERLRLLAEKNGIRTPIEKVFLLTLPRIFGYVFNPVSFYFLFDGYKVPIACVVEVSNTFHEMKTYIASSSLNLKSDGFRLTVPKYFYVSPFGKFDDKFDFVLPIPGASLRLCIDTVSGIGSETIVGSSTASTALTAKPAAPEKFAKVLVSSLSGSAFPWSERALFDTLWRYPLMTVRVMALIHWQAFLLFCKKIPFFLKEQDLDLQRDVLNPHISLKNGSRENDLLENKAFRSETQKQKNDTVATKSYVRVEEG